MDYLVVLSEDGELINVTVKDASAVECEEGVYAIYGEGSNVLFTAPTDSVVYIQAERTVH